MSESSRYNGIGALELTMRDVLGGLEDLANGFAWQATGWDSVEVIRPLRPEPGPARHRPVLAHNGPASQVA